MDNINNIYANAAGLAVRAGIKTKVNQYSELSKDSNITYEPLPGTSFVGPPLGTVTRKNVKQTILTQHTTAYWSEIGVQDWASKFGKTLSEQDGIGEAPIAPFFVEGEDDVEDEGPRK